MKYYNDMGVDVTLNIQQQGASLLAAINENIKLKEESMENKENLEKRAATIKRLRRQLKEKEETICQLEKKTHPTRVETPLELTE